MSTQGLVSVTDNEGVLLKVVAGCDGQKAGVLSSRISEAIAFGSGVPSAEEAYLLAVASGFGCGNCLVVLTPEDELHHCEDELSTLYRETFGQPAFNPRWELGTAEHTHVLNVPGIRKAKVS